MLEYVVARLKEPSTWRGVLLLGTALGTGLTPAQADLIITLGLGAAGLVGTLLPDAPR